MIEENQNPKEQLTNKQEKQPPKLPKRGTDYQRLIHNQIKNKEIRNHNEHKGKLETNPKKVPRPLPRLQKSISVPLHNNSPRNPKPLSKRTTTNEKTYQFSQRSKTITDFQQIEGKNEEEQKKIRYRSLELEKPIQPTQKESLDQNIGSENKSKEQKEIQNRKVPENAWLAKLMKEHPEILQTRERTLPFTNLSSFGKLFQKEKTENKERVGGKELFHLIYQFLLKEGLTESAKLLQKESKIQLQRHYSDNDSLTTLLFLSVSNVDKIWRLNYQKLWDHLGKIEESEVLIPERKAPLLAEEEDELEDINIWDEPEENENNILYRQSEDQTNKKLHAANLNQLILQITHPEINDLRIMNIFLMTYQSFTSPGKLLLKLFQRYQRPENLKVKIKNKTEKEINTEFRTIKLRTVHLLKRWIDHHFSDFNEGLLEEVNIFIKNNLNKSTDIKLMEILKKSIKNLRKGDNKEKSNNQTPPEPKVPKNIFRKSLTLFDIDEEEIARQISLIDFEIFSKIRPAELLNCAWSKDKLKHRAKNVLKMTNRFNAMSEWAATLIIQPERVRQRVKVLKKFINIAQHLYQLNNFNSLMSILSGISSSAVHRLSFTFGELKPKTTEIYENLKTLMSGKDNYKIYRGLLKNAQLPCIPFLGFYQTDLTFIEDGNPDYINGLINFSKRALVYDVIYEIEKYQVNGYNLHPVYQISLFLNKFPRKEQKILYQMSLKREPRKAPRNEILF
ncbi:ras guanine nucleotide exchange factor i-related [Anaeramoeba flamelloides]|uniref:Ras guanine nucleotide exchange factor i-related n=1 Tax=Anaeramoeba flamelloides TaxID=1746091 RepID=A0ABQ8YCJ0_9EUKA|nr:ras guanine nucleotide exchange factor i-related [Anaeramoeba flamelloides]